MKLTWKWRNTSQFWQNKLISWATFKNSKNGALYWMKQLFIINTNSIFNFHPQKQITSSSYQFSISFTYGLQHYCFFGQTNLYRLSWFWQIQRQIWTIFLVQNESRYFNVKLQNFKNDDNKEFRLVQNLTMRETEFNRFMRLIYQLVNAAENSSTVLIPTTSEDMDQTTQTGSQGSWLSGSSKQNDLTDCIAAHWWQAWVFLCSSQIISREKDDEKFQQIEYVKYKLEDFIHRLDVMTSVKDKDIKCQPIYNVF